MYSKLEATNTLILLLIFVSDHDLLLIRCYTIQFDNDYNHTASENYTNPSTAEYEMIQKRIEEGIQQITRNKDLTLTNNITITMIDEGVDSLNHTTILINIVISNTGKKYGTQIVFQGIII